MSARNPDPVETWAPLFTKHFKDSQIVDTNFCIVRGGSRTPTFCKLCDSPVPTGTSPEKHAAKHAEELKVWRRKRKKETDASKEEKQKERQALKDEERAVLGTSVPEERRLANRITSTRYKLNHPEKHGREKWSRREEAKLHDSLTAAVKALDDYRAANPKEA